MTEPSVDLTGVPLKRSEYATGALIYSQGDACGSLFFIEQGTVRVSVVSASGKEAIIAVIDAGHFVGESCLTGQPRHLSTATAATPSVLAAIEPQEWRNHLHTNPELANHFLADMLQRNARIEADLVDQLFNGTEKRLARTLLLMAHYGEPGTAHRVLPRPSQTLLAEMVGTTRSRVNAFMNKFRKLGFIEYNGELKINHSLLTVVLREGAPSASGATAPPLEPRS